MPDGSDERSRILGGSVALGSVVAAALFLWGVSIQSYWALALPLGAAVLFVLGLVFWIGWTIATVHVDAEGDPLPVEPPPAEPTAPASEDEKSAESADRP